MAEDKGFEGLTFGFTSQAESEDAFSVVSFEGREGLSELYAFTVELASSKKSVDLDAVMNAGVSLTLKRQQGNLPLHGILESFSELHEANGLYFYRAVLRPRLWRLTLARKNQVFVNESIQTILQKILEDGGLPASAFEFKLQSSYPARDFVCQYGETLYDFFLRWLTRYGMYYYFEQGDSGEKLVVTDTKLSHSDAPGGENLVYARTSGLEAIHVQETVHDFGARRALTPNKVTLKDYNYRKPELDLTSQETLNLKGSGETYAYGDHYRTPDDGKKLAKIRAEGLEAAAKQVFGKSFVPGLRPGFFFSLTKHFNNSLNARYLAVTVRHKGYAAMAGAAGLGPAGAGAGEGAREGEGRLHYQNDFTAIPAKTQYRPLTSRRPAIAGLMNAHVDASGTGKYAELDDQGRYRIRLPFDQSGLAPGKASAAVRMIQPYGGSNFGMHAPLHKGAEAAVGYVDGNPDRPVIIGAAPNPENKSQIDNETQTQCRLTTGGGNKLHFEDKEGSQRILLYSKTGDYMRIGAHNDPGDPDDPDDKNFFEEFFSKEGISLYASKNHGLEITCKNEFLTVFGEFMLNILGACFELRTSGLTFNLNFKFSFYLAHKVEFESFSEALEAFQMRIHPQHRQLHGTNQQVTMSDVRVSQSTSATAISHSQTSLNNMTLSQNRLETAGQRSDATQAVFDASQTKNALSGQNTQAYQDALHISQARQNLAGERVLMAQEHIQTTVDHTEAFTTATVTTQQTLQTAANKVDTAANEMEFFGIYSKV